MKQTAKTCRQAGFTLVEIMVVVVILGLLATTVIPNIMGASETAYIETAKSGCKTVYEAAQRWTLKNRGRTPTMEDLAQENDDGYSYLEGDTRDPWDNEYVIVERDTGKGFRILSYGPDGSEDTEDDIVHPKPRDDE